MTLGYGSVFLTSTGKFLPGEPVDNDRIDAYIAPLGTRCARIKRRILAENGIKTRHYAIDTDGKTSYSAAGMAARAVRSCMEGSEIELDKVTVLCTGSCGGDLAIPGFANMVQGELGAGPMHTSSHQGVCASGVAALQHAASALTLGRHDHALVVASEMPSRMFKRSRFAPRHYDVEFDAHFLRWMLSDAAGALLLSRAPRRSGPSLRLDWVHSRSFSGDHPVCMQIGAGTGPESSYLDYSSLREAEEAGAFLLKQDLRLLPRLFEIGVHEYIELVRRERIIPGEVSHFLCHYSSAKFAPVVQDLLDKSGFTIPKERWYSDLEWRGNTGGASIFVMLDDFLRERTVQPGERILCFVPESARFTVAFFQFTVVDGRADQDAIPPPHARSSARGSAMGDLIGELATIWQDYQSRLRRSPTLRKITSGSFTRGDYLAWMEAWIPQVRSGSQWMRRAKEQLREPLLELGPLIESHAADEQNDYAMLFEDYKTAGGSALEVDALARNPGGEALNAFMFRLAERENPVDLLGAIYIIEGTGQRVIPQLLPAMQAQLRLPARAFRFLTYHGANDEAHLGRWLKAVEIVLSHDDSGRLRRAIAKTARATAELYLLQFQYLTSENAAA
jgi:3-oxoacyl-[acyl-carrier-protein] synthase-3